MAASPIWPSGHIEISIRGWAMKKENATNGNENYNKREQNLRFGAEAIAGFVFLTTVLFYIF